MDLDSLRMFVKVAELASFTRAAEQLGLTKARVSSCIQTLEAELGVRLLHRTTRRVRLSVDGERLLERGQALLAEADDLQAAFRQEAGQLQGRLRVDMPHQLACQLVIPQLPDFLSRHPLVTLELSTSDRRVDLVLEGFDCVLRLGPLADSGLVVRPLGVLRMVNAASPAYLAAHGRPDSLADLAQHRLVHYAPLLSARAPAWEYQRVDEPAIRGAGLQAMASVITVTGTDAYEAACLAGLGLIQAPALGLQQWLDQGRLVEVLPAWSAPPLPVNLLYPDRRHVPQRVRAFMDWLAALLQPHLQG